MIATLCARGDFQRLRAHGRRWVAGPVWCVHRADAAVVPPRIAFAIGRSVGSAVVRNRIRRRLREILRQRPLSPGDYLIGVSPAARELSFVELRALMDSLAERCATQAGRR